jgi:putative phosphoribosyl transferase
VLYRNRREAGRILAQRLQAYRGRPDALVLGLPRGGVEVAYEVARALDLPLDVLVVRKLGVPGHEELAFGAIARGVQVINDVADRLAIPERDIERVVREELNEVERRERVFREGRAPLDLRGRIAILVDDGLATGATMRAAAHAVRMQQPKRIVVAVPAASQSACAELGDEADEVICGATPEPFGGVGLWYDDFEQTSDDVVRKLLSDAFLRERPAATHAP